MCVVEEQVCAGLEADLEVAGRLRDQARREQSMAGRAERLYGLALSLWGAARCATCRTYMMQY